MFSSDQRFKISGDCKESLKIALECALTLSGNLVNKDIPNATRVGSFCEHRQYGLVYGNSYSTAENDYFQKYPMAMSLEMLVEHAVQYLETPEADVARAECCEDGEGSVRKGWEVYIPHWAHSRTVIAVKPSWTYYAE